MFDFSWSTIDVARELNAYNLEEKLDVLVRICYRITIDREPAQTSLSHGFRDRNSLGQNENWLDCEPFAAVIIHRSIDRNGF